MKTLRWALVGLGLQGERLARAMSPSSHATLQAAVSSDIGRAKAFAEKFGAPKYYASLQEALQDPSVDALCIASPNDRHAKEIVAAAKSGKPIFAEKPLALNMKEARAIEKAVRKSGSKLFVNFILRMSEEVQSARTAIRKGTLGDITYIELHWSIGSKGNKSLPPLPAHMQWREDPKKSGGGALVARGVHLFDTLRFITGKEVTQASVVMDSTAKTVDRTMSGHYRLKDGTPVHILTSKVMPDAQNHVAIFGTEGALFIRDIFQPDSWEKFNTKAFDKIPRALAGKVTALATLEDGVAAVAISDATLASSAKKKTMRV